MPLTTDQMRLYQRARRAKLSPLPSKAELASRLSIVETKVEELRMREGLIGDDDKSAKEDESWVK